jgi:NLR family CARD domain-containing protein 3
MVLQLDLSNNELCGLDSDSHGAYTAEGITAIADALRVNGALTCIDVRQNNIAGDGAVQLAAAVLGNLKIEIFNKIPIKEMRANSLTELDLKEKYVGVEGGMVVAGLIPVMGALTSLDLSGNQLCGLDDFGDGTYTAEVITAIADALRVNGGLTALDLSSNRLKDEGVSAVCEAIQSNKETKLASLNFKDNGIGPVGSKSVAAMVAVTGSLTKIDVSWNIFGPEGAKVFADALRVNGGLTKMSLAHTDLEEGTKAICEALKQNKTLKELDLSGYKNIGGEAGAKHVADMLGVNNALTNIS